MIHNPSNNNLTPAEALTRLAQADPQGARDLALFIIEQTLDAAKPSAKHTVETSTLRGVWRLELKEWSAAEQEFLAAPR